MMKRPEIPVWLSRIMIICLLAGQSAGVYAQGNTVNLELLQQAALKNYPLLKNKALLDETNALNIKNNNSGWLPQAQINGQATYQSSVPSIPIDLPFVKIPKLDRDHYQLTLDAQQNIYDGGTIQSRKGLLEINNKIAEQQVDVELFQLKNRVTTLYFGVLLAQETDSLLNINENDLRAQMKQTESGVNSGAVLATNLDMLKAQMLTLDQKKIENKWAQKEAVDMLASLTGLSLSTQTYFIKPGYTAPAASDTVSVRPELLLYSLQQQATLQQQQVIKIQELPRLSAFGQAGYGKPGLDYFSNDFKPFYVLGLKASWNLSSFYNTGRDRQIQSLAGDMVRQQKATFDKNTAITLRQQMDEIDKVQALMEKDNDLIQIRKRIEKSTSSQMTNGAVTATDYIIALDAVSQAEQNLSLHTLQLQLAILNYQNTLGK